jgi:hypothetical protein
MKTLLALVAVVILVELVIHVHSHTAPTPAPAPAHTAVTSVPAAPPAVAGSVEGAVRVDGSEAFTASCSQGHAVNVRPDTPADRLAADRQCQELQQDQAYVQNALNQGGEH